MPFREALWHVGEALTPVASSTLDSEDQLEGFLCQDLSTLDRGWLLIGRQVSTGHGRLDLLAMNSEGGLVVIELKKHQTPREVVAQVLDYGSWACSLSLIELESIFQDFQASYCLNHPALTLQEAFQAHFRGLEFPDEEEINATHELVVVAAELDGQTERILQYLTESWSVPVRAVFFRVYKHGDDRFITRSWLLEEDEEELLSPPRTSRRSYWEGTFCTTFGPPTERSWEDARRYNFISAGGKAWFGPKLKKLRPGNQLLVHLPGKGYVALAEVAEPAVPIKDFKIPDASGSLVPLRPEDLQNPRIFSYGDDSDTTEYLVRVRWIHQGPESEAFMEEGLYKGNQNPVYRPGSSTWPGTVARAKKRWGVP